MVTTQLTFSHKDYTDEQLNNSISAILNSHNSLALATIKGNESYINTAHYGFSKDLQLVIFTQPYTQHSKNIEENSSVAVAIWTEPEKQGENLQGLQLFGTCQRVGEDRLQEAIDIYTSGNPGFANLIKRPEDFATAPTESRLYAITITRLKLIDEPNFGRRNYIELEIVR